MTNLYAEDAGWHGYTQGGSKAHRIYRSSPFPKSLTSCSSVAVVYAFSDALFPDPPEGGWCLHCYPDSAVTGRGGL